jgi:hypothetical protein
MTNSQKKMWFPPQLVVLARGTPEEQVLHACKVAGNSGPSVAVQDCRQSGCGQCQSPQGT